MRKEMKEIKENWKIREEGLERKIDDLEERIKILERQEEEGNEKWEERIENITEKGIILLEGRKGEEQQQDRKAESINEIGEEVRKLKRIMEEKEKKERKNKVIIRGLNPGKTGLKEEAKAFLEKDFGAKESIKEIQVIGRESGRGVVMVEMEKWEEKEKIMKEKSKLYGRNIFIDHDMIKEERKVQRRLRERARKEREEGKKVKVGYRKMYIESELYVWNEEGEEIRKRKNF